MDWNERFQHAINSIYTETNFSKLGEELFSLTEYYVDNDHHELEEKYDEALEKSEIMKTHFKNFGHPSLLSEPVNPAKIGETVSFDDLTPVIPIKTGNFHKTVIVCLRHFL